MDVGWRFRRILAVNIIDSQRFGQVIVNGKIYSSDIIIYSDRVKDNWRRIKGHQLCLDDIAEIIGERPEVLVVGTGVYELVKILPEVKQAVDEKGIRLVSGNTDKACETYNQLCTLNYIGKTPIKKIYSLL